MARKRVIAYFMHETEQAQAQQKMFNVNATESYLLGDIEETDIPALEQLGLLIQPVEEPEPTETPVVELERSVRSLSMVAEAGGGVLTLPAPTRLDPNTTNFYLVRIRGPLLRQWREDLEKHGVKLLEKVGRGTYTTRLEPAQVSKVSALTFVSALTLFGGEESEVAGGQVGARAPRAGPPPAASAARMMTFDVRLHRAEDLNDVRKALESLGITIAGASGRKIRIYLLEDGKLGMTLQELRDIKEVLQVERYIEPQLHNDAARILLGVDPNPGGNPAVGLKQTGIDQIVGVADTGLDDQHPDFQGRIAGLVGLGRPSDTSDPHGHGTHVSGSVLGDGLSSSGKYRGVAPKAKLFFQSLLDADGRLGGLPLNLADLFEEAYQAGARIHNNSWGAMVNSEYTMNSLEVDEFVAKRRDMLIVISAGNEGQGAILSHAKPGFVEWLSIGAPASCKNGLTVGASRSDRTAGGYSQLTYGQAWPKDFPQPPIADHNVSGDPQGLAAFSSRGPCTDRRIKPDLVAPGTDILSAKSSRAPLRNFWGPGPTSAYAYMGGTSMAAPLTAGCAALVREYYTSDRNYSPSAALLKATLINSTKKLTGIDPTADFNVLPNMHQGFGCIHMPWAIPNPVHPKLRLEFVDPWNDPQQKFNTTGQRFRWQISISGGPRLSICLVWTDAPGRALQNNLNLMVQQLPNGAKFAGNKDLPMSLAPVDQENNVELVRLENPVAGNYLIQVFANNLLTSEQDFALVVVGDLTSGLIPV